MTPRRSVTRRWSVVRLLRLADAVLLGLYALFFLVHAIAALLYPYPLNYGEGAVVATALSLRQNPLLYHDPNGPPYLSANYGPLYYLPIAASPPELAFAAGRFVSIAASLAIAAGLIHLTRPRWVVGFVLAGLWLALTPVYAWSSLAKPDLPALGLAFWGLLLVRTHLARAGALIAAAVLTKPTAGAALLVLIACAGLPRPLSSADRTGAFRPPERQRARPPWIATVVALAGLLAVGLPLILITDGWFARRVFLLNLATWSPTQGAEALFHYLRLFWPLVLAAGGSVIWRAWRHAPTRWDLYWLVTLVGFTFGAAKLGAYINYYLDPLLASLAVVGSAAATLGSPAAPDAGGTHRDRWLSKPRATTAQTAVSDATRFRQAVRRVPFLVPSLLLLQLILSAHVPFVAEPIATPASTDHTAARQLVERIKGIPDPWLAEDSGWLIAAGRPVWLDDPFYFAQLAAAGVWDPAPLIGRIERQEFSAILLDFDPSDRAGLGYHAERFTPETLDALRRSYRRTQQLGSHWVMELGP